MALLFTDYKLLSKALAKWLRTNLVSSLMSTDQLYCIPGCSIKDIVFLIRDMMEFAWGVQEDFGLIFDRVDAEYLYGTLKAFGFGDPLQVLNKAPSLRLLSAF